MNVKENPPEFVQSKNLPCSFTLYTLIVGQLLDHACSVMCACPGRKEQLPYIQTQSSKVTSVYTCISCLRKK
jgi:hypothetical protein